MDYGMGYRDAKRQADADVHFAVTRERDRINRLRTHLWEIAVLAASGDEDREKLLREIVAEVRFALEKDGAQ